MTNTMVDVLIYLFENYMDGETPTPANQDDLINELAMLGFSSSQVEKAIQWLDELAILQSQPQLHSQAPKVNAMRIYTDAEQQRLDLECRGFLLFLEQNEILDPASRELVIERTLALDSPVISEDDLKWTVLLVLMNQPGQEEAFSRMEDIVYDESPAYWH